MTTYAPTSIDLSRIAAPDAIEALDYETLKQAFVDRFIAAWAAARAADPSLPVYDVQALETDPVIIVDEAWSYLRLLDRQRVNDVIEAVLAPLAKGTNLDNVVARQNIIRRVVIAATDTAPAILETDAQLLRRYLLSFDRASAGSRDRYLFEAWTAWPGMLDARVNGFDVHGRRGDTDVVIIGPDGDAASAEHKTAVSAAVRAPHVKPEAVSVAVLDATRREYAADMVVEIAPGPDAELVRQETTARLRAAGDVRTLIGGEVPAGYLASAAYGANVIKVRDAAPVVIEPDAYTVPVLTDISVTVEVRS